MKHRTALVALGATAVLFFASACTDEPETTPSPAPATSTATVEPTSIPGQDEGIDPSSAPPSAGESDEPVPADPGASGDTADTADTGIAACQQVMTNIRAGKLPLPVNQTAAFYINFKNKFSQSDYPPVKTAGETFVNRYVEAIKAGGQTDVGKLTDAAENLIKTCDSYVGSTPAGNGGSASPDPCEKFDGRAQRICEGDDRN